MPTNNDRVTVRPVETGDHPVWADLFAQYRAFYELKADPDVVERVWAWVGDAEHEVTGLVATVDDTVVGIAHYRRFARPSSGTVGLWLDDLFVDPAERGHGVAATLIARLQSIADAEGLSVVRWITARDNDRARVLYDRVATATHWVVYDAQPGPIAPA